jgi:hypothetical protein
MSKVEYINIFIVILGAVIAVAAGALLLTSNKDPEPPDYSTKPTEVVIDGAQAGTGKTFYVDHMGRIVPAPDSCTLPVPPGKQILKNEVTGKYCIGEYFKGAGIWAYWGAQGYTDTCKLKADYLRVWGDEVNEAERNKYYKPIK